MRTLWIAVAVLAGLAGCKQPHVDAEPVETGPRYITIGTDALDAAEAAAAAHGHALRVLHTGGEVSVVKLDASDLGALATEMHRRHDRCGGFEVNDSLDAGESEAMYAHLADAARPEFDYSIDHPAEVRAVIPALDAARIHATISEMSAMKNRYYQSPTGAQAAVWLRDRWRGFSPRADIKVELVDTGYAQKSVILTIPGTTRPDEVVVIGGHLDSIALGGASATAPGADDDASGIATLTEVARVLLASDYRPARTIQLMAYAAEEVGLRGSLQIARDYQRRRINVVGALQLDMTNFQGSEKDIYLMKDFTSAAQNTFLAALIERYVGASWDWSACGYACSDHAAWHRIGVPASMPFEAKMRDANRFIHTNRDTLETSRGNAEHAVKFARLAAAYAIELAKGELRASPPPAAAPTTIASAPAPSRLPTHRLAAIAVLLLVASAWALRTALSRTA
jgi:leucyl aminopeptidase